VVCVVVGLVVLIVFDNLTVKLVGVIMTILGFLLFMMWW